MTQADRQEVLDIIIDFMETYGSQIGSEKVVDLTESELTDENLTSLVIPAVRPTTQEWVQTTLKTMMRPITRNIEDLSTLKTQAAAARDAANSAAGSASQAAQEAGTAAVGASRVNVTMAGMTVTVTDRTGQQTSTDIGFSIYRTYASVSAMNADAAYVPQGKFVIIATTDPTSEDNAKLYCKNSQSGFTFLCDLDQASSAAWAEWLDSMKPQVQRATADAEDAAEAANEAVDRMPGISTENAVRDIVRNYTPPD